MHSNFQGPFWWPTLPVKNRQNIEDNSQMLIPSKSPEVCPLSTILFSHHFSQDYPIFFYLIDIMWYYDFRFETSPVHANMRQPVGKPVEISDAPGNVVLWGGYCWVPFVERTAYMQTYHENICWVNMPVGERGMGRATKKKRKVKTCSNSLFQFLCWSPRNSLPVNLKNWSVDHFSLRY